MPAGRPTDFTPELGAELCLRLMTYKTPENSLTRICSADDMPSRITVYHWLLKAASNDATTELIEFLNRYKLSEQIRMENMFNETVEVAYDDSNDKIMTDIGERGNSTAVARARLKCDAVKWCLSKLNPQKYGERIEQHHSGDVGINPAAAFLEALRKSREVKDE